MSVQPFFTVIVPTHRRARLLRRALTSLRQQGLGESELQVVVVADLHDAATAEVASECLGAADSFVVRSGEPGPSLSRNLGLSLARGRYVLFLDDDDAHAPGALHSAKGLLEARPLDVALCNFTVVKERRPAGADVELLGEEAVDSSNRFHEGIFVKNRIHMSAVIFARHVLEGPTFDPYMRAYEDWEFMLGVMKHRTVFHMPLSLSRVHEVHDQTTDRRGDAAVANDFNAVLDYLYVYRRHPAPNDAVRQQRQQLLKQCGLNIPAACL
jgi:GalNAc5-diNAcBac-PP-undecaprenol beta-1,3-glucosyltransferase